MEFYADIIFPLALDALTFAVDSPDSETIVAGSRVIAQIERKYYTGIVWRIHNTRPKFKTKFIESIIDEKSCLPAAQMKLLEWVAEYYMAPLGMVVKAALPSLLSIDGYLLEQIEAQAPRNKTLTHVVLNPSITTEAELEAAMNSLRRSPKQKAALVEYISQLENIDFTKPYNIPIINIGVSRSIIKTLESKGIFSLAELEVEDTLAPLPLPEKLPQLSENQSASLEAIQRDFEAKDTVLFRGVTGSGKTEIYIHLIATALEKGDNVLFMIPEIALTTQLLERLQGYFDNRVVAYHSRYSDTARAALYSRLLDPSQKGLLIVGVRSSVFLPLQNMGLVIVDEEHDTSYKQSDKSPSYHARDTALFMARLQGAKSLLGSATPSLESYYNTLSGKYGYTELDQRYSGVELPEVIVSDTARAVRRGERRDHINLLLKEKIDSALESGEQVMLFQNRRGFSPYIECSSCGHVPTCPDCSVSLTYHKSDNSLRCHYCGYTATLNDNCPNCKNPTLAPQGFGTEKIEEVLAAMFPEASIARLDADSTRAMGRMKTTINNFKNGRLDILVGTQMITKGFDFGGVSTVGILNADNMLHYPDFRASERAYQTMMQVSGRAGRRGNRGQVIIQTSHPDNEIIEAVCRGDFNAQAAAQLRERELFLYPPFSRMVKITLSARDRNTLWSAANKLASKLREIFGRRTLGPEAPPLERLRGNYNAVITIKIERRLSFARAKGLIKQAAEENAKAFKNVAVYFDVDPI